MKQENLTQAIKDYTPEEQLLIRVIYEILMYNKFNELADNQKFRLN